MTDRTAFIAAALRGHMGEAERLAYSMSPVECERLALQLQEANMILIRASGERDAE